MSNNPLLYSLQLSGPWLTPFTMGNLVLALCCFLFVGRSIVYHPERFTRPGFIIAVLAMLFYQWPLALLSPLFREYLPNHLWFAITIHTAVIANLLWVCKTPQLTIATLYPNGQKNSQALFDFHGFILWFPIGVFFLLALIYFHRIAFTCTALYAFFTDRDLTLLVREMVGSFMATTYAPHVLNMLAGAVCPIVVFLMLGKIISDGKNRRWLRIPLWAGLLVAAIALPLSSGAKTILLPIVVTIAVAGFLTAKQWKWRVMIVVAALVMLAMVILLIKTLTESNAGKGQYPFGACVVELGVCEKTASLLTALKTDATSDLPLNLSRDRIDQLEHELQLACGGNTPITPATTLPSTTIVNPPDISAAARIYWLLYRAFIIPLKVASWHYLYVAEHGMPGVSGLAIAKFSGHYINVAAEVYHLYTTADANWHTTPACTGTCTAPTGYLFTYPGYLGFWGLILACVATILFDIAGALVIRYSAQPFTNLAIGLITAASINFMIADYLTVILSHGAGAAIAILAVFCIYRRLAKGE